MVILGFAGFGWVLGGFGGLGLGRLVGGLCGRWGWLVICGVGCVYMGRKRGFVWVFGAVGWGFMWPWWEIRPGNCPICEILSTLQNSQNFVNFHLSKIKGGT